MDDFVGTESSETSVDTSSEVTVPDQTSGPIDTQAGGNPSWESLRTKLDPVTFKLIEPDLRGFDSNAEKRISGLNQQLKGYTALGTPDQIKSYANIARQIDAQPEVIYQALGNFLQENGRLPQTAGEVRQVQAEADNQEQGEVDPYDERLSQLQQQQEQMREFLAEQENQRMSAEADAALDGEISQLKQAFPSFTDADIAEVIQKAAWQAQTQGTIPPLAQVAQSYIDNTVNRIRSVPRPGDSAPRLVPTSGGGVPQSTQQTSLGKRSNADVQALVAGIISQSR